jgi:hypothetical protein
MNSTGREAIMSHPMLPKAVAISVALALASVSATTAGPIVSVGGGVAVENRPEALVPLASVGVLSGIDKRWSAFVRVGYEDHSMTERHNLLDCVDCPSSAQTVSRAKYVPLTVGLRVSSLHLARSRPFFEVAPSLSWARFDRVRLQSADGRSLNKAESSRHWLVGIEIDAGVHLLLGRRTGLEWAIRYAYTDAPDRTDANRGVNSEGLSRASFGLALTL